MRLIDADVLKKHIDKLPALPDGNFAGNHRALKALINMQPTIEERKKGKWIDTVIPNYTGDLPTLACDQCYTFFPLAYTGGGHSFCPNCGADMRGEEDETDRQRRDPV